MCLVQDGVNVAGISPVIMCFNVRLELATKIAIGGMALDSHDMSEKHGSAGVSGHGEWISEARSRLFISASLQLG